MDRKKELLNCKKGIIDHLEMQSLSLRYAFVFSKSYCFP